MNETRNKRIGKSSFWIIYLICGLLWGIAEATIGCGLHCLHIPGVVYIMLPIGLLSMGAGVYLTRRCSSIIVVSTIAATVKLLDLFILKGIPTVWVLNPAIYILLEGVGAWIVLKIAILFGKFRWASKLHVLTRNIE